MYATLQRMVWWNIVNFGQLLAIVPGGGRSYCVFPRLFSFFGPCFPRHY